MRYFTDAVAARAQARLDTVEPRYEVVIEDGTRVEAPDYGALLRIIATLPEDARWTVRII